MGYCIDKEKVHRFMKDKDINTQSDLAKKLGISKNQLSVMLNEKSTPFKSNFQLLLKTLDVSPFELITFINHSSTVSGNENLIENIKNSSGNFIDVANVKAAKNYNVLELFAGAGGLALGLEKAGFNTIGLVEIDKYAAQTLRQNRPNWNVIEKDIIKVSENGIYNYIPKNIDVDIVSGGYSCQSFSYAGQKKGLDDARGTMFFYYAKILEQIMPKMFLAENVKGLTTHDNGKTLSTMISVFESIGYNVCYHILKATDYGVAQKRERTVIVGIRKDFSLHYLAPKPYDYKPVLRDVLENVPASIGEVYSEKKKNVLELVPPGGYWRDLPDHIAKEYMGKSYYSGGGRTGMARRISWDEPCLTLTCSPAQKQTERCHPDEVRPFTVREYARIQSFPDNWEFYGSCGQQYKQIGNAVPVELAKAIGLSLINVLNNIHL